MVHNHEKVCFAGVNFDEIMRVTRATGFFKWHKSRNLHSISLKIRIKWQ